MRRNHWLVGEDFPETRPLARFLAQIVPEESRICWLIGAPRAIWFGVMSHL